MRQILLLSILFIGCKKNNPNQESTLPYFMSANIDGKPWNMRNVNNQFLNATFSTDYSFADSSWNIHISGDNQSQDTLCYGISISFYFLPKKGRYYFNNTLSQHAVKGISAMYIYYSKRLFGFAPKYSIDGYVNIEEFTKDEMKGSFNFNARGHAQDSTVTSITKGAFFVYHGGGGGRPWPGP